MLLSSVMFPPDLGTESPRGTHYTEIQQRGLIVSVDNHVCGFDVAMGEVVVFFEKLRGTGDLGNKRTDSVDRDVFPPSVQGFTFQKFHDEIQNTIFRIPTSS